MCPNGTAFNLSTRARADTCYWLQLLHLEWNFGRLQTHQILLESHAAQSGPQLRKPIALPRSP